MPDQFVVSPHVEGGGRTVSRVTKMSSSNPGTVHAIVVGKAKIQQQVSNYKFIVVCVFTIQNTHMLALDLCRFSVVVIYVVICVLYIRMLTRL